SATAVESRRVGGRRRYRRGCPPACASSRRLCFLGRRILKRGDALGRYGPGVAVAALDGIAAHAVDVEQKLLTITRSVVQHRAIGRHRIFNGGLEVPGL